MDLSGPDFSDSRDPVFSDSRDPMTIYADSGAPIFNSRDPNWLFFELFLFTACHAVDCTVDSQHSGGLFSE